jgi:hypothetical protein
MLFYEARRRYTGTYYISMGFSLDGEILRRDCSQLPTTNGTKKSNRGFLTSNAKGRNRHHPKQIHVQGVMKILGTLSSLIREFASLVR